MEQLDHIIKYENKIYRLFRPLSVFHKYSENDVSNTKKGLILCHGHNHSNEIISKIKFVKYWYYVDYNEETYPDFQADVSDENDMNYFPDNYFDCVLSVYCTAVKFIDDKKFIQYPSILKIIHRILKKDGMLCMTELPGLFFWIINDNVLNNILLKVHKIITDDDFELYKNKLLDITGNDTKENIYYNIMVKNYDGNNSEKLNNMLSGVSIKYTKLFLKKNNFKAIKIKNKLLVCKPV